MLIIMDIYHIHMKHVFILLTFLATSSFFFFHCRNLPFIIKLDSIVICCVQVGGWTQVYGNILSFATIRGASHEAPFSQPERSLMLFKSFLEGRPLPEVF